MSVKILMIDDHPLQIEGYKVVLGYNNLGLGIETTVIHTCESAYHLVTNTTNPVPFDLVFLDVSLPPYPEKNIKSGSDLALLIKKQLPNSKIVMLTSHAEAFLLYDIVKKIAPIGLLVKSDFSAEELLTAFDTIMNGETYYSQTVKENIKEFLSKEEYLDNYNRQIITLISQGIKSKNLSEHINLCQSAIEKRKVKIKDYLSIEKGTDEDIVREAKKLGFI